MGTTESSLEGQKVDKAGKGIPNRGNSLYKDLEARRSME